MDSILTSIKKLLGLEAEYTQFDDEIVIHINSVFATLAQLGVGPAAGFMIEDDGAVWNDFIPDSPHLNSVKSLVYLRVRLLFDPPSSSAVLEAMKQTAAEYEWRLTAAAEQSKEV